MKKLTQAEISSLANGIRAALQEKTCCPLHAGEVIWQVLASFALDDSNDNPHEAAAKLLAAAKRLAAEVRRGDYVVRRSLNS